MGCRPCGRIRTISICRTPSTLGHSTGGGEVVHYIARHGQSRTMPARFPAWLAPVQVVHIPIRDDHAGHLQEFVTQLKKGGIRAEVGYADDRMQKRIRTGQQQKIPFMAIAGDDDVAGWQGFVPIPGRVAAQRGRAGRDGRARGRGAAFPGQHRAGPPRGTDRNHRYQRWRPRRRSARPMVDFLAVRCFRRRVLSGRCFECGDAGEVAGFTAKAWALAGRSCLFDPCRCGARTACRTDAPLTTFGVEWSTLFDSMSVNGLHGRRVLRLSGRSHTGE
jgi:hypothetical protein